VIKGGIYAYDTAREMVAEAGDQIGDLVAEAHSELTTSTTTAAIAPQTSAGQA
jgi:Protein of unknown function (DUF5132)